MGQLQRFEPHPENYSWDDVYYAILGTQAAYGSGADFFERVRVGTGYLAPDPPNVQKQAIVTTYNAMYELGEMWRNYVVLSRTWSTQRNDLGSLVPLFFDLYLKSRIRMVQASLRQSPDIRETVYDPTGTKHRKRIK